MATFFQILSDLHLEAPRAYDLYTIPSEAPYLALLGDIGTFQHPGLLKFLDQQLSKFEIVFFLLGNHEPYHTSWAEAKRRIHLFERQISQKRKQNPNLGQFVFLDQTRYNINDHVTVLGCTLHSKILDEQLEHLSTGLNDFYHIEGWDVHVHRQAHVEEVQWLNAQVEAICKNEPQRRIVIFTHHSPTIDSRASDPRHRKSLLSSGFTTDLSHELCWTSKNVKLWAFGHTHFNCDFKDEKTGKRVVTNQRGYYFHQSSGFQAEKVFSV